MFVQHDFRRNARALAHKGYWLTLAERAIRPVDQLDYLIRRWAIADHPSRLHQRETDAPLSEFQRAIGQYFRAQYDLTPPMPDRLVALVRQIEQPA